MQVFPVGGMTRLTQTPPCRWERRGTAGLLQNLWKFRKAFKFMRKAVKE